MVRLTIPVHDRDHVQGPSTAPLTLVEYGDYQCPLCRMAHPIIEHLVRGWGPSVRFVFRHFPLKGSHPYAQAAAQAVEAAGMQNKFWEMHHLLYSDPLSLSPGMILQLATGLFLNIEKFQKDRDSPEILKKIQEDFNGGIRSGVNGTPCFYLNEERYDGDLSYEPFQQALAQKIPHEG